MVSFCAAIRRDSISLLRFPFLNHVKLFSCEISLVFRSKCPCSCFSSHFCFLVLFCFLFFLFVFVFLFLFFLCLCSLQLVFLCPFLDGLRVVASMYQRNPQYWQVLSPLFSWCLLFVSYLGCMALCIVMSFLVLWSICWSSSLVHFKNNPEDLTRGTAQGLILLRIFLRYNFLVLLRYSF